MGLGNLLYQGRVREIEKKEKREKFIRESSIGALVSKAVELQKLIDKDHKAGIRESRRLDELYGFSIDLEDKLHRRIFAGERIKSNLKIEGEIFPSDLTEYSFCNFYRRRENLNMKSWITNSAIQFLPRLKEFYESLKKLDGHMILETRRSESENEERRGLDYALKARINGSPRFNINQMGECYHRSLVVPVNEFMRAIPKGWEKQERDEFEIGKYLLKDYLEGIRINSPNKKEEVRQIVLNHYSGIVFGGFPYNNEIYIGNEIVNRVLNNGIEIES